MTDRLTTREYWDNFWSELPLPATARPAPDIQRVLEKFLPKSREVSFLEIGCAPGRFMAYFNNTFGFDVSGIEYVEKAAEATRRNMELQGIEAQVLTEDFFNLEISPGSYDIVFSGGFIEHFEDTDGVISRISGMARKYVVTIVPNMFGINGLISRKIRPDVFYGHKQIGLKLLRNAHEKCGLETLFCDYGGGMLFFLPAALNTFFEDKQWLARIVNLPFRAFNITSRAFSKYSGFCPRPRFLSTHLMYIGRQAVLTG
ncbi:MAG: class I SAM-dependent methyltransferase [Planctomycetes bacterium]|nr:class I SAM-dependent methyltransferase [Planctomycetota bacterium]